MQCFTVDSVSELIAACPFAAPGPAYALVPPLAVAESDAYCTNHSRREKGLSSGTAETLFGLRIRVLSGQHISSPAAYLFETRHQKRKTAAGAGSAAALSRPPGLAESTEL